MYINVHPRQYSRVNEIKQNKDKLFTSITCTAIRHILDSVSSIYQKAPPPTELKCLYTYAHVIVHVCWQCSGFILHGLHGLLFPMKNRIILLTSINKSFKRNVLFIHIDSKSTLSLCFGDFPFTKRWIHEWITLFQSINQAEILSGNLGSYFVASLMLIKCEHYSGLWWWGSQNLLMIKLSIILVKNVITAFNCQDEIP